MLIRTIVNITFFVIGVTALVGVVWYDLPWWSILLVIVFWIIITAYGVVNISSQYFLKSYCKNPEVQAKVVAITFDDGPEENTVKILEVLKQHHAKATFFCIGKQVKKHPSIAKKIISEGHVIGNHTYTHSPFIDLYSAKKFQEEIIQTDKVLETVVGKSPRLFRPPNGVTNPKIARAVKLSGHRVIGWSKRSFDTTLTTEKEIFNRVTKDLKAGDVILLHDTKNITVSVLEQLLLFLQQNSFTTVTIDELFNTEAYA